MPIGEMGGKRNGRSNRVEWRIPDAARRLHQCGLGRVNGGVQVGVKVAVESAGVLLIEVVSSPPAAMFLKNLGGSGNAPGSTIIPAGSKVSVVE
jgi:hypothetical protein